jgi:hypothetical protein
MSRTRIANLVLVLVVVGALAYLMMGRVYGDLPTLGYFTPAPPAALAAAEWVLARRVRAAVGHDPEAKPMMAITITRLVALGKASALVGAGMAGAALGLVAYVAPEAARVVAARSDVVVGSLLAVATLLLAAAGLALERSGIAPTDGAGAAPRPAATGS